MVRRATRFLSLLLLLGMVGCDEGTKLGAKAALEGRAPVDLLEGVLDLRYSENHDAAFSLLERLHFAGKEPLLLGLGVAAMIGIALLWWRRRDAPAIEQAAFALVVAGAIGNVADRLARGYVVDFIHLAHWPVFNVADAAICAGAILLALSRRKVSDMRPA